MPFVKGSTSPSRRWPPPGSRKFDKSEAPGNRLQSARATGRRAIGHLKMGLCKNPRVPVALGLSSLPTQITGEDGDPGEDHADRA